MDQELQHLADEFNRMSERFYGVEDRSDATNARLDIMKDELRGDMKLAMERLDGLRQALERSRDEEREQRRGDQQMLYALLRDHSRRLRAIERLDRLRQKRERQ